MKRLYSALFALLLLLCSACTREDGVLNTLPPWESREFYTSGGFQDYTDYGKYRYAGLTPADFNGNPCFSPMTAEDCQALLPFIENFSGWVALMDDDSELARGYDFDPGAVTPGDMLFLSAREDAPFASYTVYFFDMESQILYYFHSNV